MRGGWAGEGNLNWGYWGAFCFSALAAKGEQCCEQSAQRSFIELLVFHGKHSLNLYKAIWHVAQLHTTILVITRQQNVRFFSKCTIPSTESQSFQCEMLSHKTMHGSLAALTICHRCIQEHY